MSAASRPLRILHLISNERWTGVAEPATSVAQEQRRAGGAVWVAAISGRSFETELGVRGFEPVREIDLRRLISPISIRRQIVGLREFIRREGIDVVHSHLIHDHWLAAMALGKVWRRRADAGSCRGWPILARTVHRLETMRRDPLTRRLFEVATDLVITVSSEQERMIGQAYPDLQRRKDVIRVIRGGVNPEVFRPDHEGAGAVRADMGERSETRVAGIVAHLGHNRGHHWLLRAAPEVVEKLPDAVIWIVGHGEIKRWLQRELRDPKYRGRVLRAGYRSEDLPATYGAMDVGLLLALGSEGSGRAALECMASGRPVIGVRRGALTETIAHGVDGMLVDENDDRALADALVTLLVNPGLSRKMGLAAREKILGEFTEELRGKRTTEAYKEVLARRRSS